MIFRHFCRRHVRRVFTLQKPEFAAAENFHRRTVSSRVDVRFGEAGHVGSDHPVFGPVKRTWIGFPCSVIRAPSMVVLGKVIEHTEGEQGGQKESESEEGSGTHVILGSS